MMKFFLTFLLIVCVQLFAHSQKKDSVVVIDSAGNIVQSPAQKDSLKKDTASRIKHSPRRAALQSAIIPGWGQVYNKKYWKVPIVYAGIGIPAYLFFDNKNWYNRTRYAYSVVASGTTDPDSLNRVHSRLKPLVDARAEGSLLNYRNEFRRNMDYSVLFFLLFWGLNVVDATVDAHLKEFDVGEDLSLKVKPSILEGGRAAGVSFVLTIGKHNRN